jgi:FkbM family methyltransferase
MHLTQVVHALRIRTRLRSLIAKSKSHLAEAIARRRFSDDLYVRDGFLLLLDRASVVDRSVIEQGDWEPHLRERLFAHADRYFGDKDQIFIDVGSYFGLYAIHASRRPGFSSIYAFEADPLNFAQLQANLFLNRLAHRVTARNLFIDAASGFTKMTRSSAMSDNRGGAGRYPDTANQQTVPCAALDDVLDLTDRRLVVKVDVENAELEAIKGMRKLLTSNRIVLQVESGWPKEMISACRDMGLRYLGSLHDHYFTSEEDTSESVPRGLLRTS